MMCKKEKKKKNILSKKPLTLRSGFYLKTENDNIEIDFYYSGTYMTHTP